MQKIARFPYKPFQQVLLNPLLDAPQKMQTKRVALTLIQQEQFIKKNLTLYFNGFT